MSAEKVQVGGNHYKNMVYQTARFGFDAGLESLGTQIAKYLTRDKGSHIENLEKAYHCIALDQQFDKELQEETGSVEYSLDIYLESDDEPLLEKYFSQFEDGEQLKAVMRQYMKANFSQAKGLLRKYINKLTLSTPKVLKSGARVRRSDGHTFSNGTMIVTVDYIKGKEVWLKETRTWLYKGQLTLV